MVKYSSFLLIASMWLSTVLCIGAQTVTSQSSSTGGSGTGANDAVKTLLQELSSVSTSSNVLVKFMRDGFDKSVTNLELNKKEIQNTVSEATEMEKKIQTIIKKFKKSGMPLKKELQSELEKIGEMASTKLSELNKVNIADSIETKKRKYMDSYKKLTEQMENVVKMALNEMSATAPARSQSGGGTSESSKSVDRVSNLIKMAVEHVFTTKNGGNDVEAQINNAHNSFFKIRDGLIRAEQIEYYSLLSSNDLPHPKAEPKEDPNTEPTKNPKTDAASLICSSPTKYVFAMMIGMLFYISSSNAM